jgi:hypothetical protein
LEEDVGNAVLMPPAYYEERKLGEGEGPEEGVSLDARLASQACSTNCALAKGCGDAQLAHVWHLLSVSLLVMDVAKFSLQPPPALEPAPDVASAEQNGQGRAAAAALASCRLRVSCGGMGKDWAVHSLGRPLFRRVFQHLRGAGDLQTLAALICTLGGPRVTALVLGEASLFASRSLDKILLR